MYEFSTDPFHITTFPAVQYMFEGIDFTSRCVIQVDQSRNNHATINILFFYDDTCDNQAQGNPTILQSDDSTVEIKVNEQYDDNGDTWVIAEFTIFNTTNSNIGCYYCYAASFDHTDSNFSNVTYYESKLCGCLSRVIYVLFASAPFNITSYEPAITAVERGSNVTLSCEITVYEDYDMNLLYVYYRYYVTTGIAEFVRYDPDINKDTENMTITVELTIELVDIQHIGLYECYARSIPADYYTDSDDEYYEVGQNTTLNVTDIAGTYILSLNVISIISCCCLEPESPSAPPESNHVTVIVTVLSILSVVTLVFIILLIVYIVHKRAKMYQKQTRLSPLMDGENLFEALDIPSEAKSTRQPSLVCMYSNSTIVQYYRSVIL